MKLLWNKIEIRIALVYFSSACLSILLSDRILFFMLQDPVQLTKIQTYKGWFFVSASALPCQSLLQEFLTIKRQTDQYLRENAKRLQAAQQELVEAYDATIEGWSKAMDLRDHETEGHTLRVTSMSMALAQKMGLTEAAIAHIRRGALLHDIGKMGIPDGILLKPGLLTAEERTIIQHHPRYAFDMLRSIGYLRPALEIPHYHHEKWDGSGYPYGLKAADIPLAARMFAIIDVYDALTSDRPYRRAWSEPEANAYIAEQSGKHFDPDLAPIFLDYLMEDLHI